MADTWRILYQDVLPYDALSAEETDISSRKQSENSYELVLKHIQGYPARSGQEVAADLGFSPATVSKHLQRAVEEELIELVPVPQGRGNPPKIPCLTSKGEELVGKAQVGKGGVPHYFHQYRVIPSFYRSHLQDKYRIEI